MPKPPKNIFFTKEDLRRAYFHKDNTKWNHSFEQFYKAMTSPTSKPCTFHLYKIWSKLHNIKGEYRLVYIHNKKLGEYNLRKQYPDAIIQNHKFEIDEDSVARLNQTNENEWNV